MLTVARPSNAVAMIYRSQFTVTVQADYNTAIIITMVIVPPQNLQKIGLN